MSCCNDGVGERVGLSEVPCPACRRRTAWQGNPYRPFCSERCKMRDLGNWALERYRVAGESIEIDDPIDPDGEPH